MGVPIKGYGSALARVSSRTAYLLGAIGTLITLGSCSFEVSAGTLYLELQPPVRTQQSFFPETTVRRWVEVDLSEQQLVAWEGNMARYTFPVSTGKDSTPTPTGSFTIQSKHPSTRMRGSGYDIPDVPYAMYYSGNYALHGAYWHSNFGSRVTHGCINLTVDNANQLYEWASVGTMVVVRN